MKRCQEERKEDGGVSNGYLLFLERWDNVAFNLDQRINFE